MAEKTRDISLLQAAAHWLDKALAFEGEGKPDFAERAFKMALKKEREYFAS